MLLIDHYDVVTKNSVYKALPSDYLPGCSVRNMTVGGTANDELIRFAEVRIAYDADAGGLALLAEGGEYRGRDNFWIRSSEIQAIVHVIDDGHGMSYKPVPRSEWERLPLSGNRTLTAV